MTTEKQKLPDFASEISKLDLLPDIKRIWPEEIKSITVPAITHMPEVSGTLVVSPFQSLSYKTWEEASRLKLDGSVTDKIWEKAVCVRPEVPIKDSDQPLAETQVLFCHDRYYLYVGVRAQNPPFVSVGKDPQEERLRLRNEGIRLSLDPLHSHGMHTSIYINALGEVSCREATTRAGYADWDYFAGDASNDSFSGDTALDISSAVKVREDGWDMELAIPFAQLEIKPLASTVLGLNVSRTATELPTENHTVEYSWMNQNQREGDVLAMVMGDMFLDSNPLSLLSIDFPTYTWGLNKAPIELRNNTDRPLRIQAATKGMGTEKQPNDYTNLPVISEIITIAPKESCKMELEFNVPILLTPECVEIEFFNADNQMLLYRGIYHFGFGTIVYPCGLEKNIDRPEVSDPDFIEKYKRYIVSKQPLFGRLTTRQKAKGDFIVKALDGSVEFDLMADGFLAKIANWLCDIYTTDEDRLTGLAYLLSQQAVLSYSAARDAFAYQLNAASILRCGGALCASYGKVFAAIASKINSAKTGKFFNARGLMLKGHSMATVWIDDRWVPFDPTTQCNAKSYWRGNHTELAGYKELAADPCLVKENGSNVTFFNSAAGLHFKTCLGNWPQGAPIE